MSAFVDSSVWFAAACKRDRNNELAKSNESGLPRPRSAGSGSQLQFSCQRCSNLLQDDPQNIIHCGTAIGSKPRAGRGREADHMLGHFVQWQKEVVNYVPVRLLVQAQRKNKSCRLDRTAMDQPTRRVASPGVIRAEMARLPATVITAVCGSTTAVTPHALM